MTSILRLFYSRIKLIIWLLFMYLLLYNKWNIKAERNRRNVIYLKNNFIFLKLTCQDNSIFAIGQQVLQKSHTSPLRKKAEHKRNILYSMKQTSCWDLVCFMCVSCSWTDGSALDYENWENGRFSRKPGQNCIQMSSQSGKQYMRTQYFKHTQVPLSSILKHSLSMMLCRSVVGRKL